MNWKIFWIVVAISVVFIVGGGYVGYKIIGDMNASKDVDKTVVNEPIEKGVVKIGEGEDAHEFIAEWHTFYNDTLGWGGTQTYNYKVQRNNAKVILRTLEDVTVKNDKIAEDFKQIKYFASLVAQDDELSAMIELHRLFHDLDIYFNGYDYDQTFGVTKFRGN
ncbi:hypothetical protein [Cytobacillus pseudoceanisediminis]|uniref:hypothetical protein n=1 Tax=Cytobacillus pseudoceanisediminis TaxID=3051614 RepID=UPI003CF6E414